MGLETLLTGNRLPILFIGSGLSRRYLDNPEWLEQEVSPFKNCIASFLKGQLLKEVNKVPVGYSLVEIPEEYNYSDRRRYLWMFKNMEYINLDEVKQFIANELEKYGEFGNNEKSYFHRLISMYDILRYKKQ